jgi:membrane protein implicated in regulation of membrane protease activity
MAWWVWILVGIAMLVLEMVTPGGLFALFFGAGALATAGLAALGVGPVLQWVAFTAVSLLLVGTLRRPVQAWLARRAGPPVENLIGEYAVLLEDIEAGATGRAELRGAPWSARVVTGEAHRAGQRCRVERVDGLTLLLRAE